MKKSIKMRKILMSIVKKHIVFPMKMEYNKRWSKKIQKGRNSS